MKYVQKQRSQRITAVTVALIGAATLALAPQVATAATMTVTPGQNAEVTATVTNPSPNEFWFGADSDRAGTFNFKAPQYTTFIATGTLSIPSQNINYTGCAPTSGGTVLNCTGWRYAGPAQSTTPWAAGASYETDTVFLKIADNALPGTYSTSFALPVTATNQVNATLAVRIAPIVAAPVASPTMAGGGVVVAAGTAAWLLARRRSNGGSVLRP